MSKSVSREQKKHSKHLKKEQGRRDKALQQTLFLSQNTENPQKTKRPRQNQKSHDDENLN